MVRANTNKPRDTYQDTDLVRSSGFVSVSHPLDSYYRHTLVKGYYKTLFLNEFVRRFHK